MYLTTPLIVALIFPAAFAQIAPAVGFLYIGYLAPIGYGLLKYRRLTSYHTIGARVAGVLLTFTGALFVWTGLTWPLYAATLVLIISAVDEMLITHLFPAWHANVPSAWHAFRMANGTYSHSPSPIPIERP
jgi:CDP-diacylglycerol--glycerol-3-phosphate 3-phosphatidyltransferase